MPEWLKAILGDTSAVQLVFWIIAVFALVAFLIKMWPVFTKAVQIINAVSGLPSFIERTDKTLAGQDSKIAEIHHEVHFNNGSSVKDAVTRVEKGVAGLYDKVDELGEADVKMRDDFEKTHPSNPIKE